MRVVGPLNGAARGNYRAPGNSRPAFILPEAKVLWKVNHLAKPREDKPRATGLTEKTEF